MELNATLKYEIRYGTGFDTVSTGGAKNTFMQLNIDSSQVTASM